MEPETKHHLTVGRESYNAGDFSAAEFHLQEVLNVHDGFADVHNMLGVIFHQAGSSQSAREHFERAIEINPRYTEAALNLAVCYNELGRYDDAKQVYERATAGPSGAASGAGSAPATANTKLPEDGFVRGKLANLHNDLGQAYSAVGMLDAAATEFRKALELCPTFVDIRTRLGTTLRDAGKIDEALDELQAARDAAADYLPARINLGVTLWSAGRNTEAKAEWEAVLAKDPENRSCKLYLSMADDGPKR